MDETKLTFFSAFIQLFSKPRKLFEKLNSSPTAVRDAAKIAVISLVLEFLVRFVQEYWLGTTPANPTFAIKRGLTTVLAALILLPFRTVLFHVVSYILGGKGSFKKAFAASCVLEILGFGYHALDAIPKVGLYFSAFVTLYWPVAIAIAAISIYKVKPAFSYGFAALVCIFTFGSIAIRTNPEIAKHVLGHDSAMLDALRSNGSVKNETAAPENSSSQEERYPAMEKKN